MCVPPTSNWLLTPLRLQIFGSDGVSDRYLPGSVTSATEVPLLSVDDITLLTDMYLPELLVHVPPLSISASQQTLVSPNHHLALSGGESTLTNLSRRLVRMESFKGATTLTLSYTDGSFTSRQADMFLQSMRNFMLSFADESVISSER